jgi:hypothetical protein
VRPNDQRSCRFRRKKDVLNILIADIPLRGIARFMLVQSQIIKIMGELLIWAA